MAIKQTLTAIVLTAGLALGATGCTDPTYVYKGKIGEEQVEFTSDWYLFNLKNSLTVQKNDGRTIKYIDDRGNDLKLNKVIITKDNQVKTYQDLDTQIGTPVIEEAQKQFDDYLAKIKEAKINYGLENLK